MAQFTDGGPQTLYSRFNNTLNIRGGNITSGGFEKFMENLTDMSVGEVEITGGLESDHKIKVYGAEDIKFGGDESKSSDDESKSNESNSDDESNSSDDESRDSKKNVGEYDITYGLVDA